MRLKHPIFSKMAALTLASAMLLGSLTPAPLALAQSEGDDPSVSSAALDNGQPMEELDLGTVDLGKAAAAAEEGDLLSPELVSALLEGEGDVVDGDEDIDPVDEILKIDPGDTGLQQMALRSPVMLGVTPPEDRQHGEAIDYVPSNSSSTMMAKISNFVLIRVKDGAGDWDNDSWNEITGDHAGYDDSDTNHIVRTQDDVTYTLAYSTELDKDYIYHTIKGTKLYVQYVLPVPATKAEFNLDAMPWLEGATVTRSGNTQTLTGYRDLPDREDEYGTYDVPGAGTVNCVIHVNDMANGETLTPEFYAWLEAPNNTTRPGTASSADYAVSPTVTVTVGTYLTMTLRPNMNQLSGTSSYEVRLQDGSTGTVTSGILKSFEYEIKVGRNGMMKGVAPLLSSESIDFDFYLDFRNLNGAPAVTSGVGGGLWDIKSMDTTMVGTYGHIWNEYSLLSAYYVYPDQGYGSISSCTTTGSGYHVVTNNISHVNPGETAAKGIIITCQGLGNLTDATQEQLNTWHYSVTAKVTDIKAASKDGTGKHSLDVEYPAATHEQSASRKGTYNATVNLVKNELSSDPNHQHSYIRLSGDPDASSSSNIIGLGEDFWAEFAVTNIPTENDMLTSSTNQYCLWDSRYVEPALSGGRPEVSSEFGSGWENNWEDKTYRYIWITKKDGSNWASTEEMRTASLTTFNDLSFWSSYSAIPSGYRIVGMVVETRDPATGTVDRVGRDNVRQTMIHMQLVDSNPAAIINKTAMFTQSYQAYTTNLGSQSIGSTSGAGTIPPAGDRVNRYLDASGRTYDKTVWNADGSINPDSLTAHNTVYEGATLLIKGFRCLVDTKFEDGDESKNFDISQTRNTTYVVRPSITNDNTTDVEAAMTTVTIPDPEHMTFKDISLVDGGTVPLGTSRTISSGGQTGSYRVTRSGGQTVITFLNVHTDKPLPAFKLSYDVNAGEVEDGTIIDLTAVHAGDSRAAMKDNGNLSTASMRIIDIEAFVIKENVNNAVVRKGDTLTYTVTVSNNSGTPQELSLLIPTPKNNDEDGTVLNSYLTYVSGNGSGDAGSTVHVLHYSGDVHVGGTIKAAETATVTVTYRVPETAMTTDVIRNSSTQSFFMNTTGSGTQKITVKSNRVETTLEPDPTLALLKKSALPSLTNGKDVYTLAGAVYEVFQGSSLVGTLTTAADGSTEAVSLEPGMTYTVKEKTAPNGYILDTASYTVNLTYDNSPYVLEVFEDPKLPEDKISKAVSKENNSVGDTFTYTVTASVPFDLSGDSNSTYAITDVLDTRLTYAGNVKVFAEDSLGSRSEIGSSNYTVTAPAGTRGGTLTVDLGNGARQRLMTLEAVNCVLQFDCSINETAAAATDIPNKATMAYNANGRTSSKTSNEVVVNTGALVVSKMSADTNLPLPGVTFALYRVDPSTGAKTPFLRNGSQYTMTTGTNGQATFHGLEDGRWALRETKTVAGYSLLSEDVLVDVTGHGSATVTVRDSMAVRLNTGGTGTAVFYLVSSAVLAAALFLALSGDRKTRHTGKYTATR